MNDVVPNSEYFEYLKNRSFLGKLYRNWWLYPFVSRLLRGHILDVGCGIGDMVLYHHNCVGVDVNELNVDYCKSLGLNVRLMPFDLIPFDNESFDSVLLDNVLEHVAEPFKILLDIKRILRPGGILVIGVPGEKGFASDSDHKVYYDEGKLEALADKSGFRVKRYKYAPLFRSGFLSRVLAQYCIYTQWQKID